MRNKKGQFASKKTLLIKIVKWIWIVAFVMAVLGILTERYVDYRLRKEWIWKAPVKITFNRILTIQDRKEPTIMSPVAIEELEKGLEIADPIDSKIYELWGDKYYLIARSVFKCESGLRPDAINWTSKDIGIAQINFPTWQKPIKEVFGYTLVDLFDPMKNLEIAYWIWDRADGTEGDSRGSFKPWVVYNNGVFVGCVD